MAQLSRSKGTVLELGFGGGVGLERLLDVHRGAVVAVDPSIEMVRRAKRRFCSEVHGRRLLLLQGIAESLPLRSGSLDAVISVHSLYYWHDWETGLREIVRTLAPSGALILGSGTKPTSTPRHLASTAPASEPRLSMTFESPWLG